MGVKESLRQRQGNYQEIYGALGNSGGMLATTELRSFDPRDEYAALWRISEESQLSAGEAQEVMRERVYQNFMTYCLERDVVESEREYTLRLEGGRWQLNTADHSRFKDLSHMALAAAKKVRIERELNDTAEQHEDKLNREIAMLLGVRRLGRLLGMLHEGESVALFYPPLPGGELSMLYVYQLSAVGEDRRVIQVQSTVTTLNESGVNTLFEELSGNRLRFASDEELSRFFISMPFQIQHTHEVFEKARRLSQAPHLSTGADVSGFVENEHLHPLYHRQVAEGAQFFLEMLWSTFQRSGEHFTRKDLERMELVFSMARRSVLSIQSRGHVLQCRDLLQDYHQRSWLQQVGGGDPAMIAWFNTRLQLRYGGLDGIREMAVGCPSAMLGGLGLQGGLETIDFAGYSGGHCPEIKCVRCGCTEIPETAKRCPRCKADSKGNLPADSEGKTQREKLRSLSI